MKLIKKIFIFSLFMVLFSGCGKSYIINSSFEEINNKINNKDSFILYIGSAECSHCEVFKPKLEDIANENKIEVFYIDVSKLNDEEKTKLSNIVSYSGTPTTAFIVDGYDPGSQTHIDGDVSKDKIIDTFKNNGYLKK